MSGQTGKTIAIMQPYLFPYAGYFQLADLVDEFWLLDTVSFIQRGWMNRNRLRSSAGEVHFTIPVASGFRDQSIQSRAYSPDACHAFDKLQRTLLHTYAKAPHVDRALSIVGAVRAQLDTTLDFTDVTTFALAQCFAAAGITTPIRRVSELQLDPELKAQARIIAACRQAGATRYVNMIGGKDLYAAADFAAAGVSLAFMTAELRPYPQSGLEFMPGLSILDMIAHLPPGEFGALLANAAQDADRTL